MAEWEEVDALVITWAGFQGICKQIVRHALPECRVIIVCDDPDEVSNYLQGEEYGGPVTDLSAVTFITAAFNSIWARDYMAESIYANEVDSLFLLDWIYNRPRPADDELSDVLGDSEDILVYSTTAAPFDLVHTGGNFMCDGAGTAFSSGLVLEENGSGGDFNQTVRDEAGVDAIMQQFMGIERYVKMPTLPYDGIHHIDMHMKLLDEETLLVGEFPVGVSDGPQLEENLSTVLAEHASIFGTPYKVVRVPMPPSTSGAHPPEASYRTYTNCVFINGTVLVPTYRTEYDTVGLRVLREQLPGYQVVGIDCDSEQNIILQSGALHCITKTMGTRDPMLIRHQPLADTYDAINERDVVAYIRHRSGIAGVTLHWATEREGPFTTVAMTISGTNEYTAAIPAHASATTVYYYVEATANNGKVLARPMVAPAGSWSYRVLDVQSGLAEGPPMVEQVFPNPTSSILVVELAMNGGEQPTVELLDALGRPVMRLHSGPLAADGRIFADLSVLPPALYELVIITRTGRTSRRVIKQ